MMIIVAKTRFSIIQTVDFNHNTSRQSELDQTTDSGHYQIRINDSELN